MELAAATVVSLGRAQLGLTQRDLEVVKLRVSGLRGPQIARRLGCSLAATYNHIARVYRKTGQHSIDQLTHWATEREVM
jgi:DNA-binding CsgD family transcriptional regulator